jgi:hypothetical protein
MLDRERELSSSISASEASLRDQCALLSQELDGARVGNEKLRLEVEKGVKEREAIAEALTDAQRECGRMVAQRLVSSDHTRLASSLSSLSTPLVTEDATLMLSPSVDRLWCHVICHVRGLKPR